MILSQLTMGARQAKNAPLNIGMKCNGYLQQKSSHAPHPHTLPHTLPVPRLVPSAPSKQFQLPISWRSQACRIFFCIFIHESMIHSVLFGISFKIHWRLNVSFELTFFIYIPIDGLKVHSKCTTEGKLLAFDYILPFFSGLRTRLILEIACFNHIQLQWLKSHQRS